MAELSSAACTQAIQFVERCGLQAGEDVVAATARLAVCLFEQRKQRRGFQASSRPSKEDGTE